MAYDMEMFETSWLGGTEEARGTTVSEVLKNGGYDWNVSLRPIQALIPDPAGEECDSAVDIPDNFAVVRDTDSHTFAVVGDRYSVIQHGEAFGVIDTLVKNGDLEMDRVQALRDGARLLIVTKAPDLLVAGEPMKQYQAWLNGHDGKMPVVMVPTLTRYFCSNIFAFKIKGAKDSYRIRHTRYSPLRLMQAQQEMFGTDNLDAELDGLNYQEEQREKNERALAADARRAMSVSETYSEKLRESLEALASTKLSNKAFESTLKHLIPEPVEESKMASTMRDQKRAEIRAIYVSDDNLNNVRGTALGFLNAVTQFAQHVRPYKSQDRKVEVLLGQDSLGQQAFEIAKRIK